MKDLQQFYMRLASALERRWTSRTDKHHAAILLRNAAIDTPHCHFCGCGETAELYTSRYNPKARICRYCVREIAKEFGDQGQQGREVTGMSMYDSLEEAYGPGAVP
jgi:hypothetical protein